MKKNVIKMDIYNNEVYKKYDRIGFTANGVIKNNFELVMGAGNAKIVRDAFNGIAKRFGILAMENTRGESNEPAIYNLLFDKKTKIFAFQTKLEYKDKSPKYLVKQSIKKLEEYADKTKERIILPIPGIGHGGLDFDEVVSWINENTTITWAYLSNNNRNKGEEKKLSEHQVKDIEKFRGIDVLISRGVEGSSSWRYARGEILKEVRAINIKDETAKIIGVSINGNRKNRISFDKELVDYYANRESTFILDSKHNRERDFNIGEQEIAKYLHEKGYATTKENEYKTIWKKKKKRIIKKKKEKFVYSCSKGYICGVMISSTEREGKIMLPENVGYSIKVEERIQKEILPWKKYDQNEVKISGNLFFFQVCINPLNGLHGNVVRQSIRSLNEIATKNKNKIYAIDCRDFKDKHRRETIAMIMSETVENVKIVINKERT